MFCKNCGEQLVSDQAVICVKCGTAKGQGVYYCANCGNPLNPGAAACMLCGVSTASVPKSGSKSKIVAGILAIFIGTFGVHNFYLGYTAKAVIQVSCTVVSLLLTICSFGIGGIIGIPVISGISIWALVEGILILCGKIDKDGKGNLLEE